MTVTTANEAMTVIARLEKKLNTQAADATKWQNYYEGKQPLRFSSQEWREWFGGQYVDFADNWCAPVVDATAERQQWTGFRLPGQTIADEDLGRVMNVNGADVEFGQAATEAQYARRAFTLVWGNPSDIDTPEVTFESPTQMVLEYEPGSRRRRAFALKRWQDEDGRVHLTLYTPDHLWKFSKSQTSSGLILPEAFASALTPREVKGEPWPLKNPMGEVPVAELPNRTTLTGQPLSAIAGVAAMQDAINMIWAHLFTASDFAALPQRLILGATLPKIPVLDADGQKIGEKPIELSEMNYRRIINLEGPTAKADEWSPASLDGFLDVIKRAVGHVTDQTRTPAYYFSSGTTIANISGDTVKALDAGLVKKVTGVNNAQRDGLRTTARLILLAQDEDSKAKAMAAGAVDMGDPEIRSEAQRSDAMLKDRQIGFPFEWVAKQRIDDPEELRSMLEARERELRDPTLERVARGLEQGAVTGE